TFVTRHTFCNAAHGGRCTIEAVYRRSKRYCTSLEYRCAIEGHVAPIERSRRLLAPCDASMLDGSRRDGVGSTDDASRCGGVAAIASRALDRVAARTSRRGHVPTVEYSLTLSLSSASLDFIAAPKRSRRAVC